MADRRPTRRTLRTGRVVNPPQVKTVEKALKLLLHLARVPGELGLQEVSRAVGVHPSTAYRLLSVLAHYGFLRVGSGPGRYALGLRLAELGHTVLERLTLREKARPLLERLMRETRETVHLMALDGDSGIYVDRIESPQRIRVASNVGYRELLHCSAIGKAILANLSSDRLAGVVDRGLPRMTGRTIVDAEQLGKHLREVAARASPSTTKRASRGCDVSERRSSTIVEASRARSQCRVRHSGCRCRS